jgi:hypothetical protein
VTTSAEDKSNLHSTQLGLTDFKGRLMNDERRQLKQWEHLARKFVSNSGTGWQFHSFLNSLRIVGQYRFHFLQHEPRMLLGSSGNKTLFFSIFLIVKILYNPYLRFFSFVFEHRQYCSKLREFWGQESIFHHEVLSNCPHRTSCYSNTKIISKQEEQVNASVEAALHKLDDDRAL